LIATPLKRSARRRCSCFTGAGRSGGEGRVTLRFPEETCVYEMDPTSCRDGDELCSIDQSVRGFASVPDGGRGYREHARRDGGCGTSHGRARRAGSDATDALPRGWHARQTHGSGWPEVRNLVLGGGCG